MNPPTNSPFITKTDLGKQACAAERQPTQWIGPDCWLARRQFNADDVGFNEYGTRGNSDENKGQCTMDAPSRASVLPQAFDNIIEELSDKEPNPNSSQTKEQQQQRGIGMVRITEPQVQRSKNRQRW
jgi:hypothetical protein